MAFPLADDQFSQNVRANHVEILYEMVRNIEASPALTTMDTLKKIRNDAQQRELNISVDAQMHATYDAMLEEELSPRLYDLLRRLASHKANI